MKNVQFANDDFLSCNKPGMFRLKRQCDTNSDNLFYIIGSSKAKVQGQNDCPRRLNTLEKLDQKKIVGPNPNVKPLMLKITGPHGTTIQQWRCI
jgi:hypothetical protein